MRTLTTIFAIAVSLLATAATPSPQQGHMQSKELTKSKKITESPEELGEDLIGLVRAYLK